MTRPLYGYRVRSGSIQVDPVAAVVVVIVLSSVKQRRYGTASQIVRSLLPDQSASAVYRLIARIRSHASRYASGQPCLANPASPRLRLGPVPLDFTHSTPARLRER